MDNSIDRDRNDNSHPQSLFQNGCGCNDSSTITVTVTPTTGGQFNLEMARNDTIDNMKRIISKKLKVSRERICLLHRERQLKDGTLEENELSNGSRLTLLPIVETGLTAQKPELSVMNALESLNEAQVNDFLSGKAPLNLTMRLGDHMMLIQLMLSTFSNQNQTSRRSDDANVSKSAAGVSKASVSSADTGSSTSTSEPATTAKKSSPVFNYLASTNTRLEKILSSPSSGVSPAPECTSKPMEIDRDDSERSPTTSRPAKPDVVENGTVTPTSEAVTATVSRLAAAVGSSECARKSEPDAANAVCTCNACPRLVPSPTCTLDSVALSEATRNLTQTLKKLSSEVLTSKRVAAVPQKYKSTGSGVTHYKRKPNAIIENMEHHGRGIYSGTFSGTLNPALQDRFGRPKKDVSTIIHILNDLLCAGPRPHCRKSSCPCNGASVSSVSTSNADSTVLSFVTADKEPSKSTAEVPANCSSASATLPISETTDVCSKSNENQTTRNKMKQLKTIMEERKEKRKAKRFSPYEKQISCADLITSTNLDLSQPWPATSKSDAAASIHATKNSESIEPDPSPSIHSEPVIA